MSGKGDCFQVAGQLCLNKQWTLCHGVVMGQGPIEGVRHWHAWVEHDMVLDLPDDLPEDFQGLLPPHVRMAVDKANGHDVETFVNIYYSIGHIDPSAVRRYSPEEAAKQMVMSGHWGPWGDDEELP